MERVPARVEVRDDLLHHLIGDDLAASRRQERRGSGERGDFRRIDLAQEAGEDQRGRRDHAGDVAKRLDDATVRMAPALALTWLPRRVGDLLMSGLPGSPS